MVDIFPDSLNGFLEEERLFYTPEYGSQPSVETRILKADFGDGYTQRAADGINNIIETWDLSWKNLQKNFANRLNNFFREKKGYISFKWIPPGEQSLKIWTCSSFSGMIPVPGNELFDFNATFRQEFDLL